MKRKAAGQAVAGGSICGVRSLHFDWRHLRGYLRSRRKYIFQVAGIIISVVGGLALLAFLLGPFTSWAAGKSVFEISSPQDRASAINAVRQAILIAVGGLFTLIGLAFTARTYYLSRSGQAADRFAKAAEMLASDGMDERIAGIYAMESIMIQSVRDHDSVIEVLAAFIRSRASVIGKALPAHSSTNVAPEIGSQSMGQVPPPDIQAAIYVLGSRPQRAERRPINLDNTDLRGANLNYLRFTNARFLGSWLHQANMVRTDLRGAWLFGMQPRWDAVGLGSFTRIEAKGVTAIQLGNCRIDDGTRISNELRERIVEIKAWWAAGYPEDCAPSWLQSYEETN